MTSFKTFVCQHGIDYFSWTNSVHFDFNKRYSFWLNRFETTQSCWNTQLRSIFENFWHTISNSRFLIIIIINGGTVCFALPFIAYTTYAIYAFYLHIPSSYLPYDLFLVWERTLFLMRKLNKRKLTFRFSTHRLILTVNALFVCTMMPLFPYRRSNSRGNQSKRLTATRR